MLPAVHLEGDWGSGDVAIQARLPQQGTGIAVQREELAIGVPAEDDAASGRERGTRHGRTGWRPVGPGSLSGHRIEGHELAHVVVAGARLGVNVTPV